MRRAGFAFLLALGSVLVPAARVAACDCASVELGDAVRAADMAFVGTLVGAGEEAIMRAGATEVTWSWQVERARDAGTPPAVSVQAPANDGANCGVSFALGERWLVLVHSEEGSLRTNGCQPNQNLGEPDPARDTIIEELVATEVEATSQQQGFTIPGQVLALGAGLLGLLAVSAWAFRRERVS